MGISPEELSRNEFATNSVEYCRSFESEGPIDRNLLGGKGAALAEMIRLNLPVPPGFTITTDAWKEYQSCGEIPTSLWNSVMQNIEELELKTQSRFGDPDNPLIISVRSGAPLSMPGILETKLNIGLTSSTLPALAQIVGNEEAGRMYSEHFDIFSEDPYEQIRRSITEVFESWNSEKAIAYREKHEVPETGTAINIQQMVWGNSMSEGAGTGVLLSRDTQNYSELPVVIFAPHAQGPKVVDPDSNYPQTSIADLPIPENIRLELQTIARDLEQERGLVPQDIEFTYDGDRLWILQTREAPLSPLASLRSKLHCISEGVITEEEAIASIPFSHLCILTEPSLDMQGMIKAEKAGLLIGQGVSVSIGTKTGKLMTTLDEARREENPEERHILADPDLQSFALVPDNVDGVLLKNAGLGSHLAREATQVASKRSMVAILGIGIDPEFAGQDITVDGNSGKVFFGSLPLAKRILEESDQGEFAIAARWLTERIKNPWKYFEPESDIHEYVEVVEKAKLAGEQMDIKAEKAQEIQAFNAGIPQAIRQEYTIIKVHNREDFAGLSRKINDILPQIFSQGNHATIRTCHLPIQPGKGPWYLVRDENQFQQSLTDDKYSKHGGFTKLLSDADLTELLVGNIPQGKMETDEENQNKHCAGTLACLSDGTILLQVHAHDPHLRAHETARKEDLITFITEPDSTTPNRLANIKTEVGENLLEDDLARRLAENVKQHVLGNWWQEHNLPQRLAALSQVLNSNVVLEVQATEDWCLLYGIKTH